ncbi:MAG: glycosyltransferase family 4 protein [Anaerolineae bacterium]|nr:glycosyltransferase family 4 protein [Anaerolineae bacterium]
MEKMTASHPLSVGFLAADLTDRHGWAHYSLSLIRALAQAGVQVRVVAARNSPLLDGIEVLPILPAVDPLDSGMLTGMLRVLPQVRAALQDCTLIHAAVEPYAPAAALVAGRRPLVVTGHGSYVLTPERRRFPVSTIYAWAYRRSTMVCVSRYTARAAERALPGLRTEVVNNGVNFERFADVRHVGGGGILSVGAVKARKGTLELVRAMAHVPGVQCRIVGTLENEPDYAAQVVAEIERLGLSDRVLLLGRAPDADLMRLYAEADVYVLASRNIGWKFEGYGLSLLEASAAGLPVIGTTDCGAEDAVIDGVTGLLVPQNAIEQALPASINRLLSDRELAARMGAAGRDHARAQTWDYVAQQTISLYNSLLNK